MRAGSLERDEGELESPIFDLDVGAGMLAEPPQVLLPVGGVDDDEETLAAAIHDEVVDDPACLVTDEVVLRLSMPKGREVIGHEALQKLEAGVAGDAKTSHVRDIEQAGDLAHREVLVADGGVLLRHLPSAEVDHPSAQGDVAFVERRALQGASRQPRRRTLRGREHRGR